MTRKVIIPLAAALAALTGAAADNAHAKPSDITSKNMPGEEVGKTGLTPNVLYRSGEDLLGLVVTRQADGTVIAQHSSHYSHSSHASHSSHRSHYSSRY